MKDNERAKIIEEKGYKFETDKEEAFYKLGIIDGEQQLSAKHDAELLAFAEFVEENSNNTSTYDQLLYQFRDERRMR